MKALTKITKLLGITLYLVLVAAILVFAIPATGWRALSVQTGSMVPAIRPGALVFVHSVPSTTLAVGDVITYTSKDKPGETITHRVTKINRQNGGIYNITVKGDANQSADAPIVPQQIVGKVVKSVPLLGSATDVLHKPIGVFFAIILPALFIIGYEIKLLVKKLTQHEVDKHKDKTPPSSGSGSRPMPTTIDLRQPPKRDASHSTIQSHAPLAVRSLGLLGIVSMILLSSGTGTRANLSSTVTLRNNSITSGSIPSPSPTPTPTPTPNPQIANHIVFRQVVMRCSVDNTTTSASRPRIVLFNPTDQDIIAANWHLEDNSGRMITLPPNTRFGARKMYVIAPLLRTTGNYGLQYAGDHLTLYGNSNEVIDGLSWGTDTTQLSQSLSRIQVGTRIQRVPARQDKNLATDFRVVDRVCNTPGQDDEFGLPAAPSNPGQFVILEQPTITE